LLPRIVTFWEVGALPQNPELSAIFRSMNGNNAMGGRRMSETRELTTPVKADAILSRRVRDSMKFYLKVQ